MIKCCKDCQNRYRDTDKEIDCHCHCEEYIREREKINQLNEEKAKRFASDHRGHKNVEPKNKLWHSKLHLYEKRK